MSREPVSDGDEHQNPNPDPVADPVVSDTAVSNLLFPLDTPRPASAPDGFSLLNSDAPQEAGLTSSSDDGGHFSDDIPPTQATGTPDRNTGHGGTDGAPSFFPAPFVAASLGPDVAPTPTPVQPMAAGSLYPLSSELLPNLSTLPDSTAAGLLAATNDGSGGDAEGGEPADEPERPANWFLQAGAFSAAGKAEGQPGGQGPIEGSESHGKRPHGKRRHGKRTSGTTAPSAAEPESGVRAPAFAVLVLVLAAIVGGLVKMTVFSGSDSGRGDTLALTANVLGCPPVAPARVVARYEKQTTTETWSGSVNTKRSEIRFVDNVARSYLQRPGDGAEPTDILVDGRRFTTADGREWDEAAVDPEQVERILRLPFQDLFGGQKLLNEIPLDGTPVCYYSAALNAVNAPDGLAISNAQIEIYLDPSGTYRRIRIRGERVGVPATTAIPGVEAGTDVAGTDVAGTEAGATPDTSASNAVDTYLLTVDFAEIPAFVAGPPTRFTTSF